MSQNISEIIKALSNLKVEVKARFKAEIKGIFGSFVRSEEKPDSDIDIYIETADSNIKKNLELLNGSLSIKISPS